VEGGSNLFDGMAEDSYVMLHKFDDASKSLVYVGKLFPGEATEEFLQESYGGGRWRCQEKVRDERGSWNISRTRTVMLAGPSKRVEDMPIRNRPGGPTGAPVVGTLNVAGEPRGNSREMLDAAMTSQVMDLLKMSKEVRPSSDDKVLPLVMQQVTAMQGMLMKVMEVMSTPREPVGDPMANMVAMMGVMAEMFKTRDRAEAPTDVTKLIEGMRALKDLSDDVNSPPGSTGDPIMDSIPRVLGLVESLASGQRANSPMGGKPTVATPNAAPQVQAPLWHQLIVRSKGLLLNVASRGVNPEDAAQSMTVMMPEQHIGILKEFLAQADAVSTLMNTVPELQNFPDWTKRFVAALTEMMKEDEGEEGEELDVAASPD